MTAALLPVPGQTWVDGDGHSWCDDGACVDVRLPVGDATLEALQQRLRIRVGPTSLRVELDGQAEPLLDVAELHAECLPHQTAWNLDEARRAVVVRLTKRDVTVPWSSLDAHGGGVDAGAALATRAKVEALLRAAADGDEAALRTAATQLDDGEGAVAVVAAVKDGNARGALHFAALRGHAELCTVLVREFGMAPDARDADGDTPLALAARGGCVAAASALLAAGADARAVGARDGQPIHHAAAAGNAQLLRALLAAGASADAPSPAGPPLLWAAAEAQAPAIEALLSAGADVGATSAEGVHALITLAALGPNANAGACARALLAAGANAQQPAALPEAFTALHVAADTGAAEVAAALLAAGGDADAADAHGHTPLHIAAATGDVAMTALLMRSARRDERVVPWEPAALIAAVQAGRLAPEVAPEAPPAVAARAAAAEDAHADAAAPPPRPPAPSAEAAARAAAAKAAGDAAFGRGDFAAARASYDAAIEADPSDAVLFANRSAAALSAGDAAAAIADAERAAALRPEWPKACYRLGAALHAAERYEDAATVLFRGVQLGGGDDMARAFKRSIDAGRAQHQANVARAAQQ